MPTHAEKRHVPHSPQEMFALVADIEKYPEFLPWCVGTRIRSNDGKVVLADMVIGYKMFREKFTSEVRLSRPDRIDVAYMDGPFKYLNNYWIFLEEPDGTCTSPPPPPATPADVWGHGRTRAQRRERGVTRESTE